VDSKAGRWLRILLALSLGVLAMLFLTRAMVGLRAEPPMVYSELYDAVEADKVEEVHFESDAIYAKLKPENGQPAREVRVQRLPEVEDGKLIEQLRAHKVKFSGRIQQPSQFWPLVLGTLLPILLLVGLFRFSSAMFQRGPRGLQVGKSREVKDRSKENPVTFADVAGVDEAKAELVEVVSFLKDPAKYRQLGARIPKGCLLVGAPGTGKTLLAKAVAGEAGVPFFSMSGSEFVEMFVGVGASRVRELFEQAKERAPCIIFIDELDAVGKARAGAAGFVANEEREQTLNQLLVEMDGFDSGQGVVVMAATNRPEILDKALLRAGRFDRQVLVDRPDVRGREAILKVHVKKLPLDPQVELRVIAQRTPGMVGADLANVCNEAALASARRGGKVVEMRDFEEAIDRIQLGLRKENRVMKEDERQRVAYHEAGHALVALSVTHSDPVHRVTIIPRSIGALGATLQLPTEERYLMTSAELEDTLTVLMGGRAAEEIVFEDPSTGAQNDLERASELARQMVCRFGMSDALGAQTFGRPGGSQFLNGPVSFEERNFSEATAKRIDDEVSSILAAARGRAKAILTAKREVLEAIAGALLAKETLERAELERLAGVAAPSAGEKRAAE
jgi:cell division protease FtsH